MVSPSHLWGRYKGKSFKCYACRQDKNASPEGTKRPQPKPQAEPQPEPPMEKMSAGGDGGGERVVKCEYAEIVEERYVLCVWLYRIKNEERNKSKYGFLTPAFIKGWFGGLLRTPQYTHLTTLEGHTDYVECLTLSENKLFSGSGDNTIRVWKV